MSYGILLKNDNENVILDSDTSNSGITVTDYFSSTTSVTVNRSTQRVFARPVDPNPPFIAQYESSLAFSYNPNPGSQTLTIVNRAGTTLTPAEVIIITFADSTSASATEYGIKIFNTDNDIALDSEAFSAGDGGLTIETAIDVGGRTGTTALNTPVNTDPRAFADITHTARSSTGSFFDGYLFWNGTGTRASTNTVDYGVYAHNLKVFGSTLFSYSNFTSIYTGRGGPSLSV